MTQEASSKTTPEKVAKLRGSFWWRHRLNPMHAGLPRVTVLHQALGRRGCCAEKTQQGITSEAKPRPFTLGNGGFGGTRR